MLVCTEKMKQDEFLKKGAKEGKLLLHNLDADPKLSSWLEENRATIPKHLGGDGGGCVCPGGPHDVHYTKHKMPCIGHWFCRNASRWYRKITSLERALEIVRENPETSPADWIIVWVDSDCRFRKQVKSSTVEGWLLQTAFFYHKSRRAVMETGVVGYHLGRGGLDLIDKIVHLYRSKEYLDLARWDDCFVTQRALALLPKVRRVDLASRVGAYSAVIPYSPVGKYIEHLKGRHGRGLNIMT